jgi:O-antigen/teichoic acid export membrane protein
MTSLRSQIVGYLPATIVPALVSFVSVYAFTRLLPAVEYGRYNVAFSGIMVAQSCCLYSLQVGFLSFFPNAERNGSVAAFVKTAYTAFFTVTAVASVLFLGAYLCVPARLMGGALALLSLLAFLLRSTVMFNQTANRAAGRMKRLNLIECLNAIAAFAAGGILALCLRRSAEALLAGLALGALCSLVADHWALVKGMAAIPVNRPLLRDIGRFAGPLALSFVVSSLLQNSDRFLLGSLSGAAAVGIYAVAVTLIDRPVTLICTAIHAASFPLMTHALEHEGAEVASRRMVRGGTLLMALTAPACVGLASTGVAVTNLMVGSEFRAGVIPLLPIIAWAVFLKATALHFLEHAFHLSRRSGTLLAIYVPVTVLSVLANYLLVPRFGVAAAAWVAVGAQAVLTGAELLIGRRCFNFAFPYVDLGKIALACTAMALVLAGLRFGTGWGGLLVTVVCGILVYFGCALALNIGGIRRVALGRLLAPATQR